MFFYARLFRELLDRLDPKRSKARDAKLKLFDFKSGVISLEKKINDGDREIRELKEEILKNQVSREMKALEQQISNLDKLERSTDRLKLILVEKLGETTNDKKKKEIEEQLKTYRRKESEYRNSWLDERKRYSLLFLNQK